MDGADLRFDLAEFSLELLLFLIESSFIFFGIINFLLVGSQFESSGCWCQQEYTEMDLHGYCSFCWVNKINIFLFGFYLDLSTWEIITISLVSRGPSSPLLSFIFILIFLFHFCCLLFLVGVLFVGRFGWWLFSFPSFGGTVFKCCFPVFCLFEFF